MAAMLPESDSVSGIFESLLPRVFVDRVILESGDKLLYEGMEGMGGWDRLEAITVTLDLVLKESYKRNNIISRWAGNQEMAQFLKVKIIQSTSTSLTNTISQNENMNYIRLLEEFDEGLDYTLVEANNLFTDPVGRIHHDATDRRAHDRDGNKTIDRPARRVLETRLDSSPRQHLAYFFFTEIDWESLRDQFGLDIDLDADVDDINAPMGMFRSAMTYQPVIDRKKVSRSSVILREPVRRRDLGEKGAIWAGEFHVMPDGQVMTGARHDKFSKKLEVEHIKNYKVLDFRSIDRVKKYKIDFSFLQNNAFGITKRSLNNDNSATANHGYFSKLNIATNRHGDCQFLFGVNFLVALLQESQFGTLLLDSEKREGLNSFIAGMTVKDRERFPGLVVDIEASNLYTIKSFKINRRRVDSIRGSNRLSTQSVPTVYDDNEVERLIASSRDNDNIRRHLVSVEPSNAPAYARPPASSGGGLREIKLDLPLQPGARSQIRHFEVRDTDIGIGEGITDGFYQYGVDIAIEDKLPGIILKMVGVLRNRLTELRGYLASALSPRNFDNVSGKFSQDFINENINNDFALYANQYVSILKAMTGFKDSSQDAVTSFVVNNRQERRRVDKDLESHTADQVVLFLNPVSATTNSVQAVVDLYEDLIFGIQNSIGSEIKFSKEIESNNSEKIFRSDSKKRMKNIIRLRHYFDEVYDSNAPDNTGYDYLSHHSAEILQAEPQARTPRYGLREVSDTAYIIRTGLEIEKYFSRIDTNIDLTVGPDQYSVGDDLSNSRYSFLSPSKVLLKEMGVTHLLDKVTNRFFESNDMALLEMKILLYNKNKNLNGLPGSALLPVLIENQKNAYNGQTPPQEVMIKLLMQYAAELVSHENFILTDSQRSTAVERLVGADDAAAVENFADIIAEDFNVQSLEELYKDPAKLAGRDPYRLYMELIKYMIKIGGSVGISRGLSTPLHRVADGQLQRTGKELYDLESPDNVFARHGLAPRDRRTNKFVMELPNQIKSVLLAKDAQAAATVRYNPFNLEGDFVNDFGVGSYFRMNYKNLKKVEAMVGYQTARPPRGEHPLLPTILIKEPIFEKLTKEVINNSIGKKLLCRLVPYTEGRLDIAELKGIELPVFDEHFILDIDNGVAGVAIEQQIVAGLPRNLLINNVAGANDVSGDQAGDQAGDQLIPGLPRNLLINNGAGANDVFGDQAGDQAAAPPPPAPKPKEEQGLKMAKPADKPALPQLKRSTPKQLEIQLSVNLPKGGI